MIWLCEPGSSWASYSWFMGVYSSRRQQSQPLRLISWNKWRHFRWVRCDATRRLNRKDVIPWDASPSGLIVKHAHQSFHNWNATGRKEGTLHMVMVTHYLVVYFSHQVHVMSGKVETGFPSSDDLIIGPVLNFPSSASSLYSNQMDRTWTCDWINIKIDRLRALPCMQTL